MDNLDIPEPPVEKVFSEKAVRIGTFLGGPLVAGYLMAENFKAFNETEKANNTWIISIVSSIVIFAGLFLLPFSEKIPNSVIPLASTAVVSYLVQKYQGPQIQSHVTLGGQTFGWWRVIIISLIGLAVTILPIIFYSVLWEVV